jgi:hypothetical protein
MTQGRGGSLGLPRMALSSTTRLLAHWRSPGLDHFTLVAACRSLCLRFVVLVASHHAKARLPLAGWALAAKELHLLDRWGFVWAHPKVEVGRVLADRIGDHLCDLEGCLRPPLYIQAL